MVDYGRYKSLNEDIFRKSVKEFLDRAVNISQPVQERLRKDVTKVIQQYPGSPRTELFDINMDYSAMSSEFPKGRTPTTFGEAQDILLSSHIPQIFAGSTETMRNTPSASFPDVFQNRVANYLESLADPYQAKGYGVAAEPGFGVRAGYYGARTMMNQMSSEGQIGGDILEPSYDPNDPLTQARGINPQPVQIEQGLRPLRTREQMPPELAENLPYVGGTDAQLVGYNMAMYENTLRKAEFTRESIYSGSRQYFKGPYLRDTPASEMIQPQWKTLAGGTEQLSALGPHASYQMALAKTIANTGQLPKARGPGQEFSSTSGWYRNMLLGQATDLRERAQGVMAGDIGFINKFGVDVPTSPDTAQAFRGLAIGKSMLERAQGLELREQLFRNQWGSGKRAVGRWAQSEGAIQLYSGFEAQQAAAEVEGMVPGQQAEEYYSSEILAYNRRNRPQFAERLLGGSRGYASYNVDPRQGRDVFPWETEGTLAGRMDVPYASGARAATIGTGASQQQSNQVRQFESAGGIAWTPERFEAGRRSNIRRSAHNVGESGWGVTIPLRPEFEQAYQGLAKEMGMEARVDAGDRWGMSFRPQQNVPLLPARAASLQSRAPNAGYTTGFMVGGMGSRFGGGGSRFGGGEPPDEPPDYVDAIPEPEPEPVEGPTINVRKGFVNRPEYLASNAALEAGKNVVFAKSPGWGKTAAIQYASIARGDYGANIVLSPQTNLNKQLARDLREAGIKAHWLPGKPDVDAPEAEQQDYIQRHNAYYADLAAAQEPEFDEYGNQIGTRWTGKSSVTAVMTPEKFSMLGKSRLGKRIKSAMEAGPGTISIDEAQEIFKGSNRYLMKDVLGSAEANFPDVPVLATGGTLTKTMRANLVQELGGPGNVEEISEKLDLKHVDFRLHSGKFMGKYAQAGADIAARQGGGGMILGYSTKVVDEISDQVAKESGRRAVPYHKGEGLRGSLDPEHMADVEREFAEGLDPNATYVSSPAARLGLNLRLSTGENLSRIGQVGPTRGSDLAQTGARVRPMRDKFGKPTSEITGQYDVAMDPAHLESWAKMIEKDMRLMGPAELGSAFMYAGSKQGEMSPGWRKRGDEIQAALGEGLKAQGIHHSRSSEAMDFLQEAKMIELEQVQVPTDLKDASGNVINKTALQWKFANVSGLTDAQTRISKATFLDPFERDKGRDKALSYNAMRGRVASYRSQEYQALADIAKQTAPLGEEFAGEALKRGLYAQSEGGVEGLQNFAGIDLPKQIAGKYIAAIKTATEAFESQSEAVKTTTRGHKVYDQQIADAGKMLSASPRAQRIAAEAFASSAAGQGNIPGSPANIAGLGTVPPAGGGGGFIPWGGGRGGQPPITPAGDAAGGGRRGRGLWGAVGKGGQALYGMYIAKRMFGMFGGLGTQGMGEYTAAAQAAGPMDFYGGTGYDVQGAAGYDRAAAEVSYQRGEGAYGMWGAPMQAANEYLSTRPALARFTGAAGSALALGAGGMMLGSGMMNMFLSEGAAAAVAPLAPYIAGGAVAGVMGYYGYTEAQQYADTVGEAAGQETGIDLWKMAKRQTLATFGLAKPFNIFDVTRSYAAGEETPEEFERDLPPATLRMAERMREELGDQATTPELLPYIQGAARMFGKAPEEFTAEEEAQLRNMWQKGASMGIQGPQYLAMGTQYAGAMGLYEGTQEYARAALDFGQLGQVEQQKQLGQAQMAAQRGAMLAPYVGGQKAGLRAAEGMDYFETRGAVSLEEMFGQYGGKPEEPTFYSIEGKYESAQMVAGPTYAQELAGIPGEIGALAAQRGAALTQPMLEYDMIGPERLADKARKLGRQYGGLGQKDYKRLSEAVGAFAPAMRGYTDKQYEGAVGRLQETFGGYTEQQWQMTRQIMGGDLRAASWAAQTSPSILTDIGMNVQGAQLYDPSGNRMFETSGVGMMNMISGQAAGGNPAARATQARFGTSTSQYAQAGQWMGVSAGPMLDAYMTGGTRGAQDYARERSHELGMASRGWAREDWAMDDTVRGFQTGWQMEDINEQLRFAGGRERRQLLRQRDRTVTMQNLEEQQITTSRGRQEEVWAREDERFQKQVEYAEKMMDYDRRQWTNSREQRERFFSFERKELNRHMDEYKKRYKLEGEMIELQRDHQAAMLQLQKESAGIQAEQARLQHDLDKVLTENARTWGDIEGYLGNINKYDNMSVVMGALAAVLGQMSNLSPAAVAELAKVFGLMQTVPTGGWFNKVNFEKAKFD